MNLEEKQISSEYIYQGKIIKLRRDTALLPNGKNATREVVEHNGGVCVAALTDNDEVLFVKQFRYPYMEIVTEIPAGKRDSADEDPLACGKRELKEIVISPEVVDPDDVEMLQDLIIAAVNEGMRKAEEENASNISSITGGLNIPGLF